MLADQFAKQWPRAAAAIEKRPKDFTKALKIVGAESTGTGKVCELSVQALDYFLFSIEASKKTHARDKFRRGMEDIKKYSGLLASALNDFTAGQENAWNDALFREVPKIDKIANVGQVSGTWPIHPGVKRVDAAVCIIRALEKIANADLETMDLMDDQYRLERKKRDKGKPNYARLFEPGGQSPSPLWVLAFDTIKIFELAGLKEDLNPNYDYAKWNEFVVLIYKTATGKSLKHPKTSLTKALAWHRLTAEN